MNFLRKLSCFHKQHPSEIAHPYHNTLPPPKPILAPAKTPSRFPTNTTPSPSTSHDTPESSRATRIASQAPQIPAGLFTNPTVRVVSASPTSELEGDGSASRDKDMPKSPSSWLTTASEESAGLGAERVEDGRKPGGDLRTLPSVKVTMHGDQGKEWYHAR
ncbi:hypothetical protein CLAFUW4_05196 [Fulvia fulva]|uniref:Uncharacterized protein n=1 Tax=Passalora fulva TaxID=5499 RepID=A0A9Q8PHY5_PASFU|nr:uncharacterized protein CLAFUR5_11710 [Fulvia fulva]KAK4626194.1 hypothetical protein CLAFUR4_05182 [Fulvia fulva]KAK4627891.1 hypothetical protein CLAFUR0_05188 [Fulvia fulva]UJO22851.1 hypothetical protein CLAFUR5_11710 [Fulvia fulva]WPV13329.1 hypothetical protein CLAFUW4_05196 [Fulvia fulva]WPV29185.1 hypothetical protein CLAFUW7_05192 [Fulvia fulva]